MIEMRINRRNPKGVWVFHAEDESKSWACWHKYARHDLYPVVEILPAEVPELLDLRFVVGLVVHVSGCADYQKAKRLHDALVAAKAKRVITSTKEILIDSESGEWGNNVSK